MESGAGGAGSRVPVSDRIFGGTRPLELDGGAERIAEKSGITSMYEL